MEMKSATMETDMQKSHHYKNNLNLLKITHFFFIYYYYIWPFFSIYLFTSFTYFRNWRWKFNFSLFFIKTKCVFFNFINITYDKNGAIYITNSGFDCEKVEFKQNKKYTLSLNKYATYTPSEYKSLLNSRISLSKSKTTPLPLIKSNSKSFDLRDKGVVNEFLDVGQCNACWAFTEAAILESLYAITTGKLESFSQQHLINCTPLCGGCNGGSAKISFDALIKYGGYLCYKSDYEYTASQGKCRYYEIQHVGPVFSNYYISIGNENEMADEIEKVCPASSIIDASKPSFQLYNSGIYDEPSCSSFSLNLDVCVVGIGIENETKYWIVRNS